MFYMKNKWFYTILKFTTFIPHPLIKLQNKEELISTQSNKVYHILPFLP